MKRCTIVVDGPLAFRMRRIMAARHAEVGVQITTLPQLAARLVGGFTRPARSQDLDPPIRAAFKYLCLANVGLVQGNRTPLDLRTAQH